MPSRHFPPTPQDDSDNGENAGLSRSNGERYHDRPGQPAQPIRPMQAPRAGELEKVLPKFDPNDTDLSTRRELVGRLWLQGLGDRRIATALGVSPSVIKDDIKRYRVELALQKLPNRNESLQRTLTVHRMVQAEAWSRLAKLPDNALNAGAFLNIVLQAEAAIMRAEGTSAPDAISAAAMAEMQELMLETLRDVAGPEGMRDFARRLGLRAGTSVGLAVASAIDAEDAEEETAAQSRGSLSAPESSQDVDDENEGEDEA